MWIKVDQWIFDLLFEIKQRIELVYDGYNLIHPNIWLCYVLDVLFLVLSGLNGDIDEK